MSASRGKTILVSSSAAGLLVSMCGFARVSISEIVGVVADTLQQPYESPTEEAEE
jgi:hypothetical protein